MGRRGFLKMLAGLGGGIAAAKTGLLKFAGKEPAKQVAKEVVKQSASTPPPYFFKLAEKIKMLGDDATATTDRTIAKTLKSKDGKSTYLLEEDITSGDTIIKKINKEGDEMITDIEIMELKKGEVVMGKDEWLFLSKNVSDSKGNYQLPSTQIYQLALKYYRQQEWFDERNIPYYLAIAPNKTSFYPEYIVTSMKGLTRWEQLKEEFNRIGVRYVDLSVPLLASKEHEELFYKKDTHWNGKGSMLAYNYLLREIAKDVPTIRCFSIDELTAVVRDNEKSDLNRMIGMGDQHDASHIDFIKEGMQELPVKIQRGVPLVLKGLNEEAPSVLLYHDSFAFKWGPYFYNYFSEATSVWYPLMDLNYIESRKPDIVIHQMVERFLTHGI